MQRVRRRERPRGSGWDHPRIRTVFVILAFAAVTTATCLIAYPRMFTGFGLYDDEGYMLIALKGFMRHGGLYDRTFSQYGPFYYEWWGALFSLLGIATDHDGGRAVTLVVWILASVTIGVATARMIGSLVLGLVVQMLVFSTLVALTNEPMHPGGLVCLLLTAIVATACAVRGRASPYAMAALGGAVAALVLVKINVGAFALASVVLACVVGYPALARRRLLRPAAEGVFTALPLVVMLGQLGAPWVREYALHVSVAALAVVIALRAGERERRPAAELPWLLGGFVVVAAVVVAAIVAAGTTPNGLFEGIVRQPLHQADAFTLPLARPKGLYLLDSLALVGAVAYLHASRRRMLHGGTWLTATSLLRIAVGLTMALAVSGDAFGFDPGGFEGYPFSMLGFCWIAVTGPPPGDRSRAAFARLLLPLLAVLQALHAFPVAGSQIAFSSFLLIPVGAVCVADGVRGLSVAVGAKVRRRVLPATVGFAAMALIAVVANAALRDSLHEANAAYHATVPLDLPGAAAVHVGEPEAEVLRQIAIAIHTRCPALLMLPGMNSFYLWARQEPPTGENATTWLTLFDDARQQRVIDATRSIRGLCLLENPQLVGFWTVRAIPTRPLIRYMRRGFRPIASFGPYTLLKREATGT